MLSLDAFHPNALRGAIATVNSVIFLSLVLQAGDLRAATAEDVPPDIPPDIQAESSTDTELDTAISEPIDAQLAPASSNQDYGFLDQQIDAGEAAQAQRDIERIIDNIEQQSHRYHPDLVEPLMLLGDAQAAQDELDDALESFSRARHIARVSHGLFDRQQLNAVYREADVLKELGDLPTAGKREEYAYEIMRRTSEDYSADLLPATHRLARFYIDTYNYLAARSLYSRALQIHDLDGSQDSDAAIKAYRGLALTHRLERFPPFYIAHENDNQNEGPQPALTTNELRQQHLAFNTFPAGEKALQRVVDIRLRQSEKPEDAWEAKLELADWHMMFGRANDANALYTHVFQQMTDAGQDAQSYFSQPKMIYWPLPFDPKPPPMGKRGKASVGHVKVGFSVHTSGRIRKLKTLESVPQKMMDFRVRRSMRQAIFRPRLLEAMPVVAEEQHFVHRFNYFPRLDREPVPDTLENPTESSEAVNAAEHSSLPNEVSDTSS